MYSQPKTASSHRTVTLGEDAATLLREHRARQDAERRTRGGACGDAGLVFCTSQGRPLDRRTIRRKFRLALRQAHVRAIRFHDLRRAYGRR